MPDSAPDLFMPHTVSKQPRHIYTVSQITQDIKLILENTFAEVWVEGEVSGLHRLPTGTIFFSLKDNTSLLKCVMFPSYSGALKFDLKDGMQIICGGSVSVYERDGRYQLYVHGIEPKGIGSLQLALEQLKQKLEKEGLFSPAHKKPIPYLPSRIGVVTSLQGAAVKDILKVLNSRFKDVHIIINPVRVQGDGAAEEIARAINDFNRFNQEVTVPDQVEVLIVGRGGGSIEDLWAFNEETVARAIYSSKIPVISAVGHERDWTIADLVADLRAPTPSAAAEAVIPKKEELKARLEDLCLRMRRTFLDYALSYQEAIDDIVYRLTLSLEHIFELSKNQLFSVVKKLTLLNPVQQILQYKERLSVSSKQVCLHMEHLLALKQAEFKRILSRISDLSPLNILSRGYSITFDFEAGKVIKDASCVKVNDLIKTRLGKGGILSRAQEILPENKPEAEN